MRLLLIGSGGREHALAWKLKTEEPALELIVAPGNPGIAELGECVPLSATDVDALLSLARDRAVDLTIVGPEAPLELGIVDRFRAAGLPIFGPTQAAAEIETSKAFAKQLMLEEQIPTARAEMHTEPAAAKAAARRFGAPVVVKASGLAAGKGVIVCQTLEEAETAIDDMLEGNRFGAAGAEVLVEEFMEGEEISIFALTDGHSFIPLPGLQDHKRLFDGDVGPNTGGMGAYAPVSLTDPTDPLANLHPDPALSVQLAAAERVFAPVLRGMARRGRPFTGLLYAGLMVTRDGPKVVEFNCRFGDPETQALMPLLGQWPLLEIFRTIATGAVLAGIPIDAAAHQRINESLGREMEDWTFRPADEACVTTVLAAANYPETPRKGDPITLPPIADDGVFVFHAGTARDAEGRLVTAGGRVLAVSAVAPTVALAQQRSMQYAALIQFEGKQYRSDIGWREVARQQHEPSAGAPRD
jgi:phosphoribosylamine--glycine ligase